MAARKTPASSAAKVNAQVVNRYANALLQAGHDSTAFNSVLVDMAVDKRVRADDVKAIAKAYVSASSGGTRQRAFRSGTAALEAIRSTFAERRTLGIIARLDGAEPVSPKPASKGVSMKPGRSGATRAASALTGPEQALAKAIVANHPGHGQRLPLSRLRDLVPSLSRQEFDQALVSLQRKNLALLYQNDNRAMLTAAEKASALYVGSEPRHFVMGDAGQLDRLKAALRPPAAAAKAPVKPKTPAKTAVKSRAPKPNPSLVDEIASRVNAALKNPGKASASRVEELSRLAQDIEAAKLSKADKIALARATGQKVTKSMSGAAAVRSVADRLRSIGGAMSRAIATGGRTAAGLAIVAGAAALISMIAGGASSGSATAAPAQEPQRDPGQPLPPFQVNRIPSVGTGAMASPASLQDAPARPTAYLNAAAQKRAESQRTPQAPSFVGGGSRRPVSQKPISDGYTEGYMRNGVRVRGYQTPTRG